MTDEELIETLRAFEKERVENLNESARNVFNAIMKIADERDELEKRNKNLKEDFKRHVDRIGELQERIDKAIKKLSSAVNHFKTQRENNVITFTLRILKGSDSNECNNRQ